jgi:Trypsin-co-occurring domain 2
MSQKRPDGAVGLADAIEALRAELIRAWWGSKDAPLRFKPAPVELTVQVAVTSSGKGSVGIRWWLLELGGAVSRESAVTQTLKLKLDPVGFDEHGRPVDVMISDADKADQSARGEPRLADRE